LVERHRQRRPAGSNRRLRQGRGRLALIASAITEPGVVAHSGGPARIVLGDLAGSAQGQAARLVEACSVPGVDARRSDAIEVELWDKFAFLCALAGTTATARLPLGDIRACGASWSLFAELVAEAYAVARAIGIDVAPDAGGPAGGLRRRAGAAHQGLPAP
jgi:2-dehydropantoate 2-reductase